MRASDEDALLCDMAEYYHVLNVKELPVDLYATLAAGLPAESRIIRKITKKKITLQEELLAACLDALNFLCWAQSEDGQKNRKRPKSIYDELTQEKPPEKKAVVFSSVEEFERERARIIERIKENGKRE